MTKRSKNEVTFSIGHISGDTDSLGNVMGCGPWSPRINFYSDDTIEIPADRVAFFSDGTTGIIYGPGGSVRGIDARRAVCLGTIAERRNDKAVAE